MLKRYFNIGLNGCQLINLPGAHTFQSCSGSVLVSQERKIKQSPPTEPHMAGRRTNDRVLLVAAKGSFATLVSPPECNAAFGAMPHAFSSVDQSPVRHPRTLTPSATRTPGVGFWRGLLCVSETLPPGARYCLLY
jgi:hypothetical protein